MVFDNLFSVVYAAVADFDVIAIHQGEGSVANIGVNVFAAWRDVPEDVAPLSLSAFSSRWFVA